MQFNDQDRRFLTRQRGISDGVVAGLEALGVTSIESLAALGAEQVCRRLQAVQGRDIWGNRRRALQAAIDAALAGRAAKPHATNTQSDRRPS
jgi:hypothetical protein